MRSLLLISDPEERRTASEVLDEKGYEVLEGTDPQAAVEKLEDGEGNIVVADYEMPGFSGADLVNRILAAGFESDPFVILLTDEDNQSEAARCLGPVHGDFLIKPLSAKALLARISIAERSIALQADILEASGDSESLALYDRLTGVLNRQAVYEQALAELSRAQRMHWPLSLAMVEINNLTEVRETQGPDVRNTLIRYVARAIRANVRIYDLVGRWIGAKFLLMLPGATAEDTSHVVDRVQTSIATIGVPSSGDKRIGADVSVGITCLVDGGIVPLYMLIEQANLALQRAGSAREKRVAIYQGE